MALVLNSSRRRLSRNILMAISSLLIIAGLSLMGVYVYWYYTGDEIIKLPVVQVVNSTVEEKPITETERQEYTVAPGALRYLSVPDIGVANARILPVGLEQDSNRIASPVSIFDVGWFNQSGQLGDASRAVFLDGHNGGPTKDGVFKHLPDLKDGSQLTIERGDGKKFTYKVVENFTLEVGAFDDAKMSSLLKTIDSQPTISIITCTGKWIQAEKTYTHRNVIRAIEVE